MPPRSRIALACLLLSAAPDLAPSGFTPSALAQPALTQPALAQPALTQSATPAPAAAPALSESKFLGVLYAEIVKRTPKESPAGAGEVTASFHVNGAGKIDKVTIDKTTSPALAELVRKILADVVTPPPPGGSMDVGQTFKFH